jgi:hypothetical protein
MITCTVKNVQNSISLYQITLHVCTCIYISAELDSIYIYACILHVCKIQITLSLKLYRMFYGIITIHNYSIDLYRIFILHVLCIINNINDNKRTVE